MRRSKGVLLAVASIALVSCTSGSEPSQPAPWETTGASVVYRSVSAEDRGPEPVDLGGMEARLTFTAGSVRPDVGCNKIALRITTEGRTVRTDPMRGATTEIACGEKAVQEGWLVSLFHSDPEWRIESDGQLVLAGDDKTLRLERVS